MINLYDIAYALGIGISSPYWLARRTTRQKVLRALSQRTGRVPGRDLSKTAVMIHAVSLGEINATRTLVDLLRIQRAGLHFIISVTTETGFARAGELYGSATDVTLVRYPLDFSSAVDRLLNTLLPSVVVLMELEVWPNFIGRCVQRRVPVVLVNGRISEGSFRRYRMARPLVRSMFSRLHRVCAQDENYARRFIELGVSPERVEVTGTMKFDTAQMIDDVVGPEKLAAEVGVSPGRERIWVCGSTGPGEEEIVLTLYRKLLEKFSDLRLLIVPRKPDRFDEVARLIQSVGFGLRRRTGGNGPVAGEPTVVLIDTLGELRKCYALADAIFVGRTLVDLGSKQHGSDMIEPAALAKPVVVGPFTGNFADVMNRFVAANAIIVVNDVKQLEEAIAGVLADPAPARAMGIHAREVVEKERGATQKHAKVIIDLLRPS